jgi:hypothetical protein
MAFKKVAREEKRRTEREARLAQLDDRDTSFEELQAVTKKEFAGDKPKRSDASVANAEW